MFNKQKSAPQNVTIKGTSPAASTKGKEADLTRLMAKDPSTWAVNEVGMWLDFIELGEYKINFIENSISGQELFELSDEDLASMGLTKLGHRKKFLKTVQSLKGNSSTQSGRAGSAASDDEFKSNDSSGPASVSSGGDSMKGMITVKASFNDQVHTIKVKDTITVHKLKKKIKRWIRKENELEI